MVVTQGSGAYSGEVTSPTKPPKRDTAILPEDGHLILAFKTDNPGAWRMHCHIRWHTEEGFATQFVERYDEMKSLIEYEKLHSNRKTWDAFENGLSVVESDSGI